MKKGKLIDEPRVGLRARLPTLEQADKHDERDHHSVHHTNPQLLPHIYCIGSEGERRKKEEKGGSLVKITSSCVQLTLKGLLPELIG